MLLVGGLVLWDVLTPRNTPAPVEATDLKSSDDHPPRFLRGQAPLLPGHDLAVAPTIVVRALVDTNGRVTEASIYRPRAELAEYERAALVAVRSYDFTPASKAGKVVPAWINHRVTFDDPSQVVDTVRLKGSDTIGGELAPRLGAAFQEERPDLRVTVDALGTATAFGGLFDESADIGLASRAANPEEVSRAAFLHVKLVEHVFAYDGIAVIVHPENPLGELSLEQVSRVFSGNLKTWKDLGVSKGGPIHLLGRPSYSGTHAFFLQRVVKLDKSDSPDAFSKDVEPVERSEDIVAKVAADRDSIAYVGLSWVQGKAKPLALSNHGPAVRPTEDTIQDATYPVSRPLLMYTRGAPKQDAAAFIRFVLGPTGQAIIKADGFVPTEPTFLVVVPRDKPKQEPYDLWRLGFGERSTTVLPVDAPKIGRVVEALKQPGTKALVIGNAESGEGDEAATSQLAEQRARSVSDLLTKQGVPAASITVKSDGAIRPVAGKGAAQGAELNRRVEIFVVRETG
jgi:phosphate binding protein